MSRPCAEEIIYLFMYFLEIVKRFCVFKNCMGILLWRKSNYLCSLRKRIFKWNSLSQRCFSVVKIWLWRVRFSRLQKLSYRDSYLNAGSLEEIWKTLYQLGDNSLGQRCFCTTNFTITFLDPKKKFAVLSECREWRKAFGGT